MGPSGPGPIDTLLHLGEIFRTKFHSKVSKIFGSAAETSANLSMQYIVLVAYIIKVHIPSHYNQFSAVPL